MRSNLEFHPDVIGDNGEKLKQLQEAFASLDPDAAMPQEDPPEMPSWMRSNSAPRPGPPPTAREQGVSAGQGTWVNIDIGSIGNKKDFKFGGVPTATMDWYEALTNIRVRAGPDIGSAPLPGQAVRKGETVKVDAFIVIEGQKYLKLKGRPGWIFEKCISGEWDGRQIVRRL